MIVRCVRTKISEFPFTSEEHLDYFRRRLRGSQVEKGFDDLIVGKEYVVYAITESRGYPFYFVETSDRPFFDYHLEPGPCFEIVDSTVSKYWHYNSDVYTSETVGEIFHSALAIKEWFKEFDFLHRLIDTKPHEIEIWTKAAKKIKSEALEARAKNFAGKSTKYRMARESE